MTDTFIQRILDSMGWFASFFITLTPDNYMFVELAAFLTFLWLIAAVILLIITAKRNKKS